MEGSSELVDETSTREPAALQISPPVEERGDKSVATDIEMGTSGSDGAAGLTGALAGAVAQKDCAEALSGRDDLSKPAVKAQADEPASAEQSSGEKTEARPSTVMWGSRSVEDFERLAHVGEGTFGQVYMARDKENGFVVALKKARPPPRALVHASPAAAPLGRSVAMACAG
jgi:hypothetical protein